MATALKKNVVWHQTGLSGRRVLLRLSIIMLATAFSPGLWMFHLLLASHPEFSMPSISMVLLDPAYLLRFSQEIIRLNLLPELLACLLVSIFGLWLLVRMERFALRLLTPAVENS